LRAYLLLFHKAKNKIIGYSQLTLNKRVSLIFILTFATIVVFDSTIVEFTSYSGVEMPVLLNIAIFIIFCIVFVASSGLLLVSVVKIAKHEYKPRLAGPKYLQVTIIATQILSFAIILTINVQILILNKYSLVLLMVETYISHISALGFLSILAFLFVTWLTSKKSYKIMSYTISFSLVSVNLIVSLLYLELFYINAPLLEVKPYPIASYVTNFGGTAINESLSVTFDALSLTSFLLMWAATVFFLSQYRYRMGNIKYLLIMSIPLVYYIFPFQAYFGDILFTLIQSSPVLVSIVYILIFSATKQVGALLFSLSFWTASSLVYNDRIRKSLLITSIGMTIVFGSAEITPLQYHVYPPYGVATEAFIPLGSYLLLLGIFISAKNISRDSELRRDFYKSAASQLTLLKAIGVSQMEKELEKQVKYIHDLSKVSEKEEEAHLEETSYVDEEKAKEILHDVLNELYYSKSNKEESDKG
jgi:hypothetical protein